ncbi:transcriptional regulator [Salinivibrio kushneri]|uniref:FMN-binding negative transcriptional regulator n=1 Tax=Salinivibrio kushneri TaxID=1908198 RepID=UPI000989066D|nr:FMN-binding negative transcriptional regulator [Salinivibrio kushneri]OOE52652.1 transcriptional regulator [Salinivibrio kushneri]
MHIPKNMEMTGEDAIKAFISDYGFGILVSNDLNATHLPLIYEAEEGALGCLYGHFGKANAHWKVTENQRVVVIFNGPHSYISPSWYETKPAVPTWNYSAVHCYGVLKLLSDKENEWAMKQLVAKYDPALLDAPETMPSDYQAKLRQSVVGFKIVVDDIHAKEKLGQHRKSDDQMGVFAALSDSTHPNDIALSAYMKKRNLGIGNK